MDEQERVAAFIETHDLDAAPAYRVLDLVSEVGELAKEVNLSTEYGWTGPVDIAADEVGDTLFALLALAESMDVDAAEALGTSIEKYERRLDATGDAGSG